MCIYTFATVRSSFLGYFTELPKLYTVVSLQSNYTLSTEINLECYSPHKHLVRVGKIFSNLIYDGYYLTTVQTRNIPNESCKQPRFSSVVYTFSHLLTERLRRFEI